MGHLKGLLGDSFIYGIGTFLLRATQVLILPLILFYLNKEEFGTLDFFLNIKNILVIVYGWGILTSIFKFYDPESLRSSVPYNGLLVIISISLIPLFSLLLLMPFIKIPKTYIEDLLFIQIVSMFNALLTVPLGIFRQRRKPLSYVILNLVYVVSFLGISYLLIITTNQNYRSILWGHLFASVGSFMIGFIGVRRYITFRFSVNFFRSMFDFGFSILLNSLSFVLIFGLTRFFLKSTGSFEDIGVLGMAQRLSLFVGALLISPFTLAWLPFVKAAQKKEHFNLLVNRVFSGFLWVGLMLCLILELFVTDFFTVIGSFEYFESHKYVLPFSLSYFFQGLYFIFSAGIFLSGNTQQFKIIGIFGIIINLLLYTLFYRALSINTVSLITLTSFVLVMIASYLFGNRTMGIRVFSPYNISIVVVYGLLICAAQFLPESRIFDLPFLLFKACIVILLVAGHFFIELRRYKNG